MEMEDYLNIIYLIVILIAFWLTWLWRSRLRKQKPNPQQDETVVNVLGEYSPVLTWLRGRYRNVLERQSSFSVKDKILKVSGIVSFCALICVTFAQYLIEQRQTNVGPFSVVSNWNDQLHIDLINWNNMVVGAPLLIIGGILFAMVNSYRPWLQEKQENLKWPTLTQLNWRRSLRYLVLGVLLMGVVLLQLRNKNESFFPLIIWLIALSFFSILIYHWDRHANIDLRLRLSYVDWAWMLVLLMVGLVVGSYYLRDIPARLIGDEGNFWETARTIAVGDYKLSPFGPGVYTFPIASSYFQGLVMRLFGINLWGWRFSSVLAGVLTVVPLYLFTRLWFERRTAVVASFAMLMSPYFLAFVRLGYNNSQSLFAIVLTLFLWSMAIKRSSYFYCWLAGLAAGFSFYTYTAAQLGVIVIALTGLYILKQRRISLKAFALVGVLVFTAWVLVMAPRIIYELSNDIPANSMHKMWESVFFNVFYGRDYFDDEQLFRLQGPLKIGNNELFFEPVLYAKLLGRGFIRSLLVFHSPFFNDSEHFVETGLVGGLIVPVFFTFGLAVAIRDWFRFRFALLLLWLGSGVLFLSVVNTFPPRYTHLVTIIPVIAVFVAVGVVAVAETLVTSLKLGNKARTIVVPLFLILSVFLVSCVGWYQYFEKIEEAYPDSLEQAVSWAAWRLEDEDVMLAYVEPTPQEHNVAYLVRAQIISQGYKNFATTDLFQDENPLVDADHVIAFFPEDESGNVAAQLRQTIANAGPQVAILDKHGRMLGYAITNITFDFNPTLTFGGGFRSLLYSPFWKAFLFPLIGLLLVLLFALRANRLPKGFQVKMHPSATWLASSDLSEEDAGGEMIGDMQNRESEEFKLRLTVDIMIKRARRNNDKRVK
jgi:4-amino-4-deoxy-L-arabinose transferase-like glycosyltransferase